MVKINIICVGKIKDGYIRDGMDEFRKRLSRYVKLSIIELAEENDNKGVENAIIRETRRIIDLMAKRNNSYNILLDLKGKMKTSEEMSEELERISLTNSEINFIIGGSNGVGDELRQISDFCLKFSPLTFPHQLMRLILIEQIYRWVTISKNIKYHK